LFRRSIPPADCGTIIGMLRRAAPLCSAAFATVILTAATVVATLDWPHGERSELPSPDNRHIIYGEAYRRGLREGPELWLRHRGRADRKRLVQLGSTAKAFWFEDSRHFLVIDRDSSSSMNSYLYDTEGRVILDLRAALLKEDAELGAVASGHFYVEAQRFLDAHTVRVAAFGHTDAAPVRCFRFIYKVGRGGETERLSMRISPATATQCDERSE
jgi:hypothetical protein